MRQFGTAMMIAMTLLGTAPARTVAQPAAQIASSIIAQTSPLERAALAGPLVPADLYIETIVTGLAQPVLATHAGDGSGRLFVIEQAGRIRIIKNGALLGAPFLDIQTDVRSGGERGLLALAFHPSYGANGYFYVMYTAPRPNDANGSVLTLKRFPVSGNADLADAGGGQVLLTIEHPSQSNHNGGMIAFGPDGYLYWSTGDGGGGGDPYENGQDLTKLLGKVLRLDVDAATPYAIPAGNPFVESPVDDPATLAEIWAYGLRNPWRMSFDRGTGDLYIGDVGQSAWEEIDHQPAASAGGENYGWDVYEADVCYEGPCDPAGKTLPVTKYSHSLGCSVTGGYVYRGSNFPSLQGYYLFGDYCSGRIWALHHDGTIPGWVTEQIADTTYNISSFGEDEAGQVYVTDLGQGRVLRLGYQDPLAFEGVQPTPSDGSSVCTTPRIGADLLLSDATRDAGGQFDLSKVKLHLDGTDVTALATVRVGATNPNIRAELLYTAPAPIALGTHMATLTYAAADGPLTAAWNFTVISGSCSTSAQQLSAPGTAAAASTEQPSAALAGSSAGVSAADTQMTPSHTSADVQEAATLPAEISAAAPQYEAQASPTPRTTSSTAAGPPMLVTGASMSLPGCMPWGVSCPSTIIIKR